MDFTCFVYSTSTTASALITTNSLGIGFLIVVLCPTCVRREMIAPLARCESSGGSPAVFSHRLLRTLSGLLTWGGPSGESPQKLRGLSGGRLCSHMHVLLRSCSSGFSSFSHFFHFTQQTLRSAASPICMINCIKTTKGEQKTFFALLTLLNKVLHLNCVEQELIHWVRAFPAHSIAVERYVDTAN